MGSFREGRPAVPWSGTVDATIIRIAPRPAYSRSVLWRLGTMGFGYPAWAGTFYPSGLDRSQWLSFYARHFDSIELDTTFHAMPSRDRVRHWGRQVGPEFRFAIKTPRTITHDSPLVDDSIRSMHEFVDVARELETQLAFVLIQFGPGTSISTLESMRRFLESLPRRDVTYAVEFRHPSWFDQLDTTGTMLGELGLTLVAAEYDTSPRPLVRTSEHLYLRLIGRHDRYPAMNHEVYDPTRQLQSWHRQIIRADRASPVEQSWVLFNNDYAGYSIATAQRFGRMAGVDWPKPMVNESPGLFDDA
jgi:uncharacterized protein YecE (DUF72 family)